MLSCSANRVTQADHRSDASRFLAQSQGRLSFTQQDADDRSRNPLDRRRLTSNSRYVQRPSMANPYQPSGSYLSRLPFAPRRGQEVHAPLFSAETFEQEDDEVQHERDMADYMALRESRRNFGPSHLTESSDLEDDGLEAVDGGKGNTRGMMDRPDLRQESERGRARGPGIFTQRSHSVTESEASTQGGKGKGRLVDIDLASTIRESAELFDDLERNLEERPPAFQKFHDSPSKPPARHALIPQQTDPEAQHAQPHPPSPDEDNVPQTVVLPSMDPPRHDVFWGSLYKIALFAMMKNIYRHP